MIVVEYPELLVTFQRGLHEVLRTYFTNGGPFTFFNKEIMIHRCQLHYNKDNILEVGDRPKIAILGTRMSREGESPGKCFNGQRRVMTKECIMERMVNVIVPRGQVYQRPPYSGLLQEADKEMADQIWQNLLSVCHGARMDMRERGIWRIDLDDFPQENSDSQFWVNTGRMRCFVRYNVPFET